MLSSSYDINNGEMWKANGESKRNFTKNFIETKLGRWLSGIKTLAKQSVRVLEFESPGLEWKPSMDACNLSTQGVEAGSPGQAGQLH